MNPILREMFGFLWIYRSDYVVLGEYIVMRQYPYRRCSCRNGKSSLVGVLSWGTFTGCRAGLASSLFMPVLWFSIMAVPHVCTHWRRGHDLLSMVWGQRLARHCLIRDSGPVELWPATWIGERMFQWTANILGDSCDWCYPSHWIMTWFKRDSWAFLYSICYL